jgi:hypothetical protein
MRLALLCSMLSEYIGIVQSGFWSRFVIRGLSGAFVAFVLISKGFLLYSFSLNIC